MKAEMDGLETLVVRINSPGGDISVGSAIANEVERTSLKTIAMVDGIAASMASCLLCFFDEVQMAANAKIMIHNPRGYARGESDDLRTHADLLDDMKEDLLDRYEAKTKMKRDKVSAMMDKETWLNSKEAKKLGFVDLVYNAVAKVKNLITAEKSPDAEKLYAHYEVRL